MTFTRKQTAPWHIFYLAFALGIFVYVLLRAIYVPVVHDESITFFRYVHSNRFMPYEAHWDVNNHFVNSVLSWLSYSCFGSGALAIRLPNVLAFVVFAWYGWRLTAPMQQQWLRFVTASALVSAVFVLEFFSLCRGYGLSMAFLLAGIYHTAAYYQRVRLRHLVPAILYMALAAGANLSLLVSFMVVMGLAGIRLLPEWWKTKNWRLLAVHGLVITVLGLLPFYAEAKFSLRFREMGALYHGSLDGLIPVTLNPLLDWQAGTHAAWLQVTVIGLLALMLVSGLVLLLRKETGVRLPVYALLLGNVVAAWLMAYLLGVNYPKDRAALYFIPLFILGLGLMADQWSRWNRYLSVVALVLVFFPVHLYKHANLDYVALWPHQEGMEPRYYDYIQREQEKNKTLYTIGGPQHMAWQYYSLHQPVPLMPMQRDFEQQVTDFCIIRAQDREAFSAKYRLVDQREEKQLALMERKEKLRPVCIGTYTTQQCATTTDEFVSVIKIQGALPDRPLAFDLRNTISSPEQPFMGIAVISVMDRQRKSLCYETTPLDWMRTRWQNDVFHWYRVQPGLKDAYELEIYIWNYQHQPFSMGGGKIQLYEMQ